MSLNIALLNAISALQTNTRALDVTAQNVSNVNTEGYSRKTVQQQAVLVAGQGAGVEIASITRKANEFLTKELRGAMSQLGDNRVRDDFYGRTQDLFGSLQSNSSLGAAINDLATTFQALADTPEDVALRTDLIEKAKLVTRQFNDVANQIESLRREVDRNIAEAVTGINTQLTQVQDLNLRIAKNTVLKQGTSELEDQRDLALNKVAEQMDIKSFNRDNGEVVVFTSTGRMLVDRSAQSLAHNAVTGFDPAITYAAGAIDGITLAGADITNEITSGRMAGLIELRDRILPNLHSQFQELATALHDEVNQIHNQGTGYPGLPSMTGTRTVAASDTPVWSGTVRVAVLDTAGTVVEFQDLNLGGLATVNDLVTAINGFTNASASIDAAGKVSITTASTNRLAINEMTSQVTIGNRTTGVSAFLGLNDFFTSADEYDDYATAQQLSATTALGLAGTLTFRLGGATTTVNYAAGDSLNNLAASINANATLAAANVTASVVTDGSGFRLRILDSDGDNFFVTDNSTLVSTLNVKPRDSGVARQIAVRSDILSDPSRVSRGALSSSGTVAVGTIALGVGDKSTVQQIANRFNANLAFDSTGLLAANQTTLAQYATEILSLNATQANATSEILNSRQIVFDNLRAKVGSLSGVNIDEEMSQLIILENAYSAAARVVSSTQDMFDMLTNLVA